MAEEQKDKVLSTENNTVFQAKPTSMKIDIDYFKYVVCGDDFKLNDKITLHHPTLDEIKEFGEQKYLTLISTLTMRPYDDMVGLDDAGLNYQDLNDYDMFLRNYSVITPDFSSIIFGELDFSKFILVKNNENDTLAIYNQEEDILIDELLYNYIATFIRTINFISSKIEYDAGNELMRKYLIKKKRKEIERRKKNPKKFESQLASIVSFLCSIEGCKYNYTTIRELKIGQLYDNYYRIAIIDERNRTLSIMSTGMVKSNDIDKSKLDWTRKIMKE